MVTAFTKVITILKAGGYQPALNVMDNECSAAVKKYIKSENINIQLVPPHNHCVNAAECAMHRNIQGALHCSSCHYGYALSFSAMGWIFPAS
jgi:hypothetical protein